MFSGGCNVSLVMLIRLSVIVLVFRLYYVFRYRNGWWMKLLFVFSSCSMLILLWCVWMFSCIVLLIISVVFSFSSIDSICIRWVLKFSYVFRCLCYSVLCCIRLVCGSFFSDCVSCVLLVFVIGVMISSVGSGLLLSVLIVLFSLVLLCSLVRLLVGVCSVMVDILVCLCSDLVIWLVSVVFMDVFRNRLMLCDCCMLLVKCLRLFSVIDRFSGSVRVSVMIIIVSSVVYGLC